MSVTAAARRGAGLHDAAAAPDSEGKVLRQLFVNSVCESWSELRPPHEVWQGADVEHIILRCNNHLLVLLLTAEPP